jgi:hypothetical protein
MDHEQFWQDVEDARLRSALAEIPPEPGESAPDWLVRGWSVPNWIISAALFVLGIIAMSAGLAVVAHCIRRAVGG